GEYLPGSLQGKISSDGCLKKEQMVVSAIASTPHSVVFLIIATPFSQFLVRAILTREKQNYVNIFIEIRSYESSLR
ncbi:hypothetical protein NEM00_14380, partial [Escherichia coli]|nr:hypothetical protein [Escherichia coli]MDI0987702.1 hypothetical protein [Escherichia coli]MDI1031351.1 hypothetical protein [Escherichia coli]